MKKRILLLAAAVSTVVLAGCEQDKPADPNFVPPPAVSDAVFYDAANHDNVDIHGEFFPLKAPIPSDVIASPNGEMWKPATHIIEASTTEYKATLPYGAGYPKVWVRVYGMNGKYSEPFLIHY